MTELIVSLLGPLRFTYGGPKSPFAPTKSGPCLLTWPSSAPRLAAKCWLRSSGPTPRKRLPITTCAKPSSACAGRWAARRRRYPVGKTVQMTGDYRLDVTAFETLIAACDSHPHRQRGACRACLERMKQAVELYAGDFLSEFFLADCPAFEEWALFKREVLRRQALEALHTLATWQARLGEWAQAERYAQRQLALEPWRELAHQQLMRLLAAKGERAAVLAQYEACRRVLLQELAVEPSADTTALYESIRDGAAPAPFWPPPPLHNLPTPLSSFVGRARELAEVTERLGNPACRLLTLSGPGGVGKSRLALEAAARVRHSFPDDVWLVELASVSEAALVPQAVAAVLGVQEEAGFSLIETLTETIRNRSLALILDNCEHLLEACAQVVGTLLPRCPSLVMLVTSREPLGIAGEIVYSVQPFSLPDNAAALSLEALKSLEAIRLFAERAGPNFNLTEANARLITELCKRLDGIPLAIELAAARAGLLPLDQMLARLDDRFVLLTGGSRAALPRHRTLRATIDWSYDLLSAVERTLLRRVSVFRGGWTLEAAEAVADEAAAVFDLLAHLVEKSLVLVKRHRDQWRYSMLETLRDYAGEKLAEAGEADAAHSRHCAFYLREALEAECHYHGPEEAAWLRRLEADHDNLRAALEWAALTAGQEAEPLLSLVNALWWFWTVRNYWSEGREWLERALSLSSGSTPARARALYRAGGLAYFQDDLGQTAERMQASVDCFRKAGDPEGAALPLCLLGYARALQQDREQAEGLFAEGLALFRRTAAADRWDRSLALYFYGAAAAMQKDYLRARSLLEESLALRRALGDGWGMADALRQLADISGAQGHEAQAVQWAEESLSLFRAEADRRGMGRALNILGGLALKQGDTGRARAVYEESLALGQEIGRRSPIALSLSGLAAVAAAEGRLKTAARLLGAVEANRAAMRLPVSPAEQADHERWLKKTRAALGKRAFTAAWAEGQSLTLEQAAAEARGLRR